MGKHHKKKKSYSIINIVKTVLEWLAVISTIVINIYSLFKE